MVKLGSISLSVLHAIQLSFPSFTKFHNGEDTNTEHWPAGEGEQIACQLMSELHDKL